MPLIVRYYRLCDCCGDTMTPRQAGSGGSESEANRAALDVGYRFDVRGWRCPKCQQYTGLNLMPDGEGDVCRMVR